ncbi:MAG: hypothetical protein K9G38_07185, partial [Bacteroidales bacterium]|nr:hypothetical protein [Bacteroidales bacterium]
TLSVIRFRNLHTRLALALLEKGERIKAVEVLDRCMELAPHSVLPYDQFVGGMTFAQRDGQTIHHEGIIESYYMCGETEKANELLSDYQRVLNERLTYFNSLKPKFRKLVDQEMYETRSQLEELRMLLIQYEQDEPVPGSGM